ncbi:MAG: long-chain fatty acid--CoA ligase [Bacteroidetes bacterium GWD2_45_23]|nr:MAG: long-chain fatty acid--CoA ligase [Bacteroidetes bacterium GWC2_46_850]OFX87014.1 MAG: long-chain fatty acid--CoA ligase [Bacteroidetes bacterium GWD2_45_23]HBB00475.1 long-chain fatty acid--CoA ligase [Porphyromonadaceae bacterium]HCC17531.1 long-chain fatty acid--CoA ligase [Porphyromonadaceae bacterium]
MIQQNFIKLYEESFKKNWELPALTDYKEASSYTYGELAKEIAKLHLLFAELEIEKGDKISLVGKNHSSWSILFMATITYGAVIVPILQEFSPDSIEHIILHSDSKLVFINSSLWQKVPGKQINVPVFDMPAFSLLKGDEAVEASLKSLDDTFSRNYPGGFGKENINYADVPNEDVICLNYTSGTTGFSKGVMITANNFAGNVTYAERLRLLFTGERILAFLPMAHVYGCAFDFLYALSAGVHITLLGVIPTPQNLIKALQEVKPNLIITVPLIFEKIYKKRILPVISKSFVKLLLRVPGINRMILDKIKQSLVKSLGGNFREVIIGGAALNAEVEAFFQKIKFPFTVGYGMTECAPLISYDHHDDFVPTSCGSVLEDIMEARIDSPDPGKIPGEIQVRGENVMKGYYKNPEATAAVFTDDGWLRTGDSGIMRGRRLFIKGRLKTMILTANGQNVYPEEIESKLNNLPYVAESLVVLREFKLVALIYPDMAAVEAAQLSVDQLPQLMNENKGILNKSVAQYEKISSFELVDKEFEKTPKRTIKRFLYH